jgi:hypothetical protein
LIFVLAGPGTEISGSSGVAGVSAAGGVDALGSWGWSARIDAESLPSGEGRVGSSAIFGQSPPQPGIASGGTTGAGRVRDCDLTVLPPLIHRRRCKASDSTRSPLAALLRSPRCDDGEWYALWRPGTIALELAAHTESFPDPFSPITVGAKAGGADVACMCRLCWKGNEHCARTIVSVRRRRCRTAH